MNTPSYILNGKKSKGNHFSFGSKRHFRRYTVKMMLITTMIFFVFAHYASATRTIQTPETESIPGSQSSPWIVNDNLLVNGVMNITSGGEVYNREGFIGYTINDSGTVTVAGAGALWDNSDRLLIGSFGGDGTLSITNGGKVNSLNGYIGWDTNSTGTVTVDGDGSTWVNDDNLVVGYFGKATLTISNGGYVSSSEASISLFFYTNSAGEISYGSVTVDGHKSTWDNSGDLYVGDYGQGSLTISNGGSVNTVNGAIAYGSNSSGTVTVDGSNSTWNNSNYLYVALFGQGSLAVTNGGSVSNTVGWLGYGVNSMGSNSTGTVTVDGSGSNWINESYLLIGVSGTGSVTVSNNGLVRANDGVILGWLSATSSGSLELYSGGVLETLALEVGYGSAQVTFDDGKLRAIADNQYFIAGFDPSELIINAGGLTIDDNGYDIATDSSAFSGSGGLTKIGSGTLTLGGLNSYSGATDIKAGSLKAGANGVFSQLSGFTVESGAKLDLDAYSQTIASLKNSGQVLIGSASSASSVGAVLTVSGNYESNGGSLYLRTGLGDDLSTTDKLFADSVTIGGGGATSLYIINIGGLGAVTMADGIQVVEIATISASASSAFTLGVPVTAGLYEYVLNQGADLSWYLTSFESDKSRQDLNAIYNPNIGSYLGNQYAAATMFQNIPDRLNSVRSPSQTVWIKSNYNRVRSDILDGRQSVKVKTALVQLGADLIQGRDFTAGVYTGYGHGDIDNRSRQTGTSADGKVDAFQVGAYLNWMPEKNKGPYVDLWAYYACYDNELSGAAQPWGKAKYDSNGYGLSGEAGYGFELHTFGGGSALILEPHLQLAYVNIDAENFTDGHGTRYTDNRGSGFRARAAARFYGRKESGSIGLSPLVELGWLHNHVDNSIRLNKQYASGKIGQNVGEIKIGLQGQAAENINTWAHLVAQSGNNSYESYGLQLGLAWQW